MISVDTNVIVRFLTRDDESQYRKAISIIGVEEVWIPVTVILETEWVLRYAYRFDSKKIASALRGLLGLPKVEAENAARVKLALDWHEYGLDFADALHLASSQSCASLRTFDESFIKRAHKLGACRILKA